MLNYPKKVKKKYKIYFWKKKIYTRKFWGKSQMSDPKDRFVSHNSFIYHSNINHSITILFNNILSLIIIISSYTFFLCSLLKLSLHSITFSQIWMMLVLNTSIKIMENLLIQKTENLQKIQLKKLMKLLLRIKKKESRSQLTQMLPKSLLLHLGFFIIRKEESH